MESTGEKVKKNSCAGRNGFTCWEVLNGQLTLKTRGDYFGM